VASPKDWPRRWHRCHCHQCPDGGPSTTPRGSCLRWRRVGRRSRRLTLLWECLVQRPLPVVLVAGVTVLYHARRFVATRLAQRWDPEKRGGATVLYLVHVDH